jgi:hypothetical protein
MGHFGSGTFLPLLKALFAACGESHCNSHCSVTSLGHMSAHSFHAEKILPQFARFATTLPLCFVHPLRHTFVGQNRERVI